MGRLPVLVTLQGRVARLHGHRVVSFQVGPEDHRQQPLHSLLMTSDYQGMGTSRTSLDRHARLLRLFLIPRRQHLHYARSRFSQYPDRWVVLYITQRQNVN